MTTTDNRHRRLTIADADPRPRGVGQSVPLRTAPTPALESGGDSGMCGARSRGAGRGSLGFATAQTRSPEHARREETAAEQDEGRWLRGRRRRRAAFTEGAQELGATKPGKPESPG